MHDWQLRLSVAAKKALCLCCPLRASGVTSFSLKHGVLPTFVLTLIDFYFSSWRVRLTCSVSEPLLWTVGKLVAWPKNWVLASYFVSLPILFFFYILSCVFLLLSVFLSLSLLPRSRSVLTILISLHPSLPPLPSGSCHSNWLRKIMQTYLALSEISLCLAHTRLIAWRSRAALVVRLVALTLKPTRHAVGFEPRPLRATSLCLSTSLSLSVHLFPLFPLCLVYFAPLPTSDAFVCNFAFDSAQLGIAWTLVWQGWLRQI